jgi:hypothetical protein
MLFVTNIYKKIFFLTCVIFITHLQLHAQKPEKPENKGKEKTEFIPKKDSLSIKEKQKEIKDKFLKTFYDKISIKKYLREKEKIRMVLLLDELLKEKIGADSIQKNIKALGETYTDKKRKQLDSIITALFTVKPETIKKADTVLVHPPVPPEEPGEEEKADITIDQLVDKVFPLIQEKVKDEENKKIRDEKINTYRLLLRHPEGVVDTLVVDDIISKKYTLKIAQRNEVFGFHPFWRKNYDDYHFELITTLAYYGYELNGKTGLPRTLNGWDSTGIVKRAQKEGCKVVLSVFCPNKIDLSFFLSNEAAQHKFISTIIHCIKTQKANGVNLMFDMPKGNHRHAFSKFVSKLSGELKIADPAYELSVTLPAYDEFQNYDVKHLSVYVNRFIVDFSKKNLYGPLVPLSGNNHSLEKGISNYLACKVSPKKFLACMPFRGGLWDYETELFNDYVPYSKIHELYVNDYGKTYDKNTCSQRCDVVVDGDTLEQLWFDDPKTLGEKYDLILNNKMGGVAIWYLGDDHNDADMWNSLVDKMVVFDSTDVVILKKVPAVDEDELTLWGKIKKELRLYKLLFSHPCDFEQQDKAQMKADDYIGYVAGGFLLLFIIVGLYTIAQRRLLGDDWKQNNFFLSTLIVLVMLVMISGLMFFFLNPDYTSFGHSQDDCETSFFTILEVLAIGFLIGMLAMRLLVFPLIKRKETP